MKFGGTSVGSAKSILNVKRIVEAAGDPVIVVVSALGGITDKLIHTSKMAAAGDSGYEEAFGEIVRRMKRWWRILFRRVKGNMR
ncbi:aspartokinase/homoserine dehydrogenase [Bacteroides pyogenes JCM 10003]|nr:aspartokinase/homoserine dehydrogenase [Bacteroides pyogenes JCM 10003]